MKPLLRHPAGRTSARVLKKPLLSLSVLAAMVTLPPVLGAVDTTPRDVLSERTVRAALDSPSVPISVPEPPVAGLASISAEFVQRDVQGHGPPRRARVEHSDIGLRVIFGEGRSRRILLRHLESGDSWLIDKARHQMHSLEFVEAGATDSDTPSPGTSDPGIRVLAQAPCLDSSRLRHMGRAQWRGQSLSEWHCLSAGGTLLAIDYFSDHWGRVIRSIIPGARIDELHSINAVTFAERHFEPPRDHAEVSVDELINGPSERPGKYE